MPRRLAPVLLVFLVAFSACRREPPTLTEPGAVLDSLLSRTRAHYEGIRGFTVVTDDAVTIFTREGPDSLLTFSARSVSNDSLQQPVALSYALPNVIALVDALRSTARLAGFDTVGARRVYAIESADPAAFAAAARLLPGLRAARIAVDAETFDLLELRLTQPAGDSANAPVVVHRVRYDDYRTVDGLTLPFRQAAITEGLRALIPEEQRIVEGGNLALAEERAALLPPGERERRLREIRQRKRYLTEGILEDEVVVREVRITTGAPPPAAPSLSPAPPASPNGPPR
ncbi:MAG TPA: hypothetical protein VD962_09790 [Rubricoccaceae bacterium]|nr:hypothetical protein [Rubricoccaceae bacterium]